MTGRTHPLDLVPGLRELAVGQHGVVRREQLLELGIDRHHIRRQVEAERWTVVGPHAVVLKTGALSRRQWLALGVVHVGPGGALALWSCLESRGLRGWERPPVHVEVPRGRQVARLEGMVVHHRSAAPEADAASTTVWWPCAASAARAAVEAASRERSDKAAAGLLLAVTQQRIATPDAMGDELARLWRPRRAALMRATLHDAGARAESVAEVDVVRLVRRAGLPEPRRQVEVSTPEGVFHLDVVVDLLDGRTLDIEVDGVHHDDPRQRARDAARDAALIAEGYLVLRIPVSELRADPEGAVRRLRRIDRASR
jgi:hypothetical protein